MALLNCRPPALAGLGAALCLDSRCRLQCGRETPRRPAEHQRHL